MENLMIAGWASIPATLLIATGIVHFNAFWGK